MAPHFELTCELSEKANWTMVPTVGAKTVCLVGATGFKVGVEPATAGIVVDETDRLARGSHHMVTLRASNAKNYAKARLQAKKDDATIGIDVVALPSREIRTAFHFVRATYKGPADKTATDKSQREELPESVSLWVYMANKETLNRANVKIVNVDDEPKTNDPIIIQGDFGDPIKKENRKKMGEKLLEHRVPNTHLNVFFVWEIEGAHGYTQTDSKICLLGDNLGANDALVLAHETAHFLLGNRILPSRLDSWNQLTEKQQHTPERIHAHAHSLTKGELLARDLHEMGTKIRLVDAELMNSNAGDLTTYSGPSHK